MEGADADRSVPRGAVRRDGPVFLSYRRSDAQPQAEALEDLLRAAGLVVWRDVDDLRAGRTTDRLQEAMAEGLSAAVLIVTPDIVNSSIIKNTELPQLLALDEDPSFSLCIANDVPDPRDPSRPDLDAPDVLLGLTPSTILRDKKQSHGGTLSGRLEIVRDLLLHRMSLRRRAIRKRGDVITISTQTRMDQAAKDANAADLHVRLDRPATGGVPDRRSLTALRHTLPLTSDAVRASGATTVHVQGGGHLSIALALGAALPETKLGRIDVSDLIGQRWSSTPDEDPAVHHVVVTVLQPALADSSRRIAIFVSLAQVTSDNAFGTFLRGQPGVFAAALKLSLPEPDLLLPGEGARIARNVAKEIKRCSAEHGNAEVDLCFHGPFTVAVLLGRLLNTLHTVVYEWDHPLGGRPKYIPVLTLQPGITGGPIVDVHVSPEPSEHSRERPLSSSSDTWT